MIAFSEKRKTSSDMTHPTIPGVHVVGLCHDLGGGVRTKAITAEVFLFCC